MGLALFAISKVHLTAIGYVTVFESIQSLTLLLATIWCLLRYRAWGRRRDYALGGRCERPGRVYQKTMGW